MPCPQSGHLGIRKINTQRETKYGAQVQKVPEHSVSLKVDWHFVKYEQLPQPTNQSQDALVLDQRQHVDAVAEHLKRRVVPGQRKTDSSLCISWRGVQFSIL